MKMKPLVHQLALDAAKAAIGWLLVLLTLEAALQGFVSRFFNLDWLVLLALAASLVAFATHDAHEPAKITKSGATMVRLLGLLAATYAWLAIPASLPWRILAALFVLALAMLLPLAFQET